MDKLKLLIVEGNTKEENLNFNNAGCVSQSENFKQHIRSLDPNSEIDIIEPVNDNSISKIIPFLKKYQPQKFNDFMISRKYYNLLLNGFGPSAIL